VYSNGASGVKGDDGSGGGGGDVEDGKFGYSRSEWRDVGWLAAFIMHLLVVVALAVVYGPDLIEDADKTNDNNKQDDSNDESEESDAAIDMQTFLIVCIVSSFVGMASAFGWMQIARRYAESIIKFSLYMSIGLNLVMALVSFANGQAGLGILFLLFAAFSALWFYWVRNKIRFASVVLEISINVINDYPQSIGVSMAMLTVEIVWIVLWAFSFMSVANATDSNGLVSFLMLVSFYWGAEVLKNIVHVTTSGVAATWLFFAEPKQPTWNSWKRATTTSLGSICFGSLIVAFLSATKAVLDEMRRQNDGIGACLASCIIGCIEDLVRFFNVYAFSRVAIYGKGFVQSGKETWDLFKAKGWDLIVNDDLTGTVLAIGALFGFAISGGVAMLWAVSADVKEPLLFGFVGGLIGYFMCFLVMNVLRSAIATTFIVQAEEPEAFRAARPAMFAKLADAIRAMYPNVGQSV